MKNQVRSAKRKKVQTQDSCFGLLTCMYIHVHVSRMHVCCIYVYTSPNALSRLKSQELVPCAVAVTLVAQTAETVRKTLHTSP